MKLKKEYKQLGILLLVVVAITFIALNSQKFVTVVPEEQIHAGDAIHFTISAIPCTQPASGSTCQTVKAVLNLGSTQIATYSVNNINYNQKTQTAYDGSYTTSTSLAPGSYDITEIDYNDGVQISSVRWKTITVLAPTVNTCTQDPSICQPYSACDQTWCGSSNTCQHTWAINRECNPTTPTTPTTPACAPSVNLVCTADSTLKTTTDTNGCTVQTCVPMGAPALNPIPPPEQQKTSNIWLYLVIAAVVGIVAWFAWLLWYSRRHR